MKLEEGMYKRLGLPMRPEDLRGVENLFPNFVVNFGDPNAFKAYSRNTLRPEDFVFGCKFRGQPCSISQFSISTRRLCFQVNSTVATGGMITSDADEGLDIYVRLNFDFTRPENSSLSNHQSGIRVFVHEPDSVVPLETPTAGNYMKIENPGIYDIRFLLKEKVLPAKECSTTAQNEKVPFIDMVNSISNTTILYIKNRDTCILKELRAISTKCNCFATWAPHTPTTVTQMMTQMMTTGKAPICTSSALTLLSAYAVDLTQLQSSVKSTGGNWTQLKTEMTKRLGAVLASKGQNVTAVPIKNLIASYVHSIQCIAANRDGVTGLPKPMPDCKASQACNSRSYDLSKHYNPLPYLNQDTVAELNTLMAQSRAKALKAVGGAVINLRRSWDAVPPNPTASYYKQNLAVIRVRPRHPNRRMMATTISSGGMDVVQLLLDLGLILAIFLGFSLVSIFEIIDVFLSLMTGEAGAPKRTSMRKSGHISRNSRSAVKGSRGGKEEASVSQVGSMNSTRSDDTTMSEVAEVKKENEIRCEIE